MPSPWDYSRPQPRTPGPFDPFNSRVTYYAPGPGDRMEGAFETSKPNPITGNRRPSTLDDVRLGTSPFVTLASDPSRYGQTVNMGPMTYTSPIDRKSYTLPNVTGYVHDTGSAFRGRPDKLDVATGDFRGWSPQQASALVTADAGHRTVTPLEGDEADRALRPIGLPEPWRATGAGESPTEGTAIASSGGARKMPDSLMDMFQPRNMQGEPTDFNNAIAQRSNALIGMGMGLLQPRSLAHGAPAQSAWSNALGGYAQGAQADSANAYRQAQLAHTKRQEDFQRSQAAQAQRNFELQFARSGETDFAKYAREQGLTPGSPEFLDASRKWAQSKQEGDLSVVETQHPLYPDQKVPKLFNKRTGAITDIPSGALGAAPNAFANAPTSAVGGSSIGPQGGGGVSYGQGAVGTGGFGTGSSGPAYPAATSAAAPAADQPRAFPPPRPGMNLKVYTEEMTKNEIKQQAGKETAKQSADLVMNNLDRASNLVQNMPGRTTGAVGQLFSHIGGTEAANLAGLLNVVKANVSFDKLQQMRRDSPTGGALGNVSDKDMKLLQGAIGDLEQSRDSAQVLYNLGEVKRVYYETVHGPGTAPPNPFPLPEAQRPPGATRTGGASVPGAPQPGFVKGGYVFKGGDPSQQGNWAPVK